MSEMIERVANAMMKADWENADLSNYYSMARAAIEAMREPTPNMYEDIFIYATNEADDPDFADIWRRMIDAALGGKP